jgi:hypothetical protein
MGRRLVRRPSHGRKNRNRRSRRGGASLAHVDRLRDARARDEQIGRRTLLWIRVAAIGAVGHLGLLTIVAAFYAPLANSTWFWRVFERGFWSAVAVVPLAAVVLCWPPRRQVPDLLFSIGAASVLFLIAGLGTRAWFGAAVSLLTLILLVVRKIQVRTTRGIA